MEPSMSVNMKVTVPVGKLDGTARELMETGVYGWDVDAAERSHDAPGPWPPLSSLGRAMLWVVG